MSLDQVRRIMNPRSVAILGASDDLGKWGGSMLQLLRRHGFSEQHIYPVHPRHATVQGIKAWPDLASIGQPVDVALIAVPADKVQEAVDACARAGVGGCLVISSNFAEIGIEGAQRQQQLVADLHHTRVIGPNCMGFMNTHCQFSLCHSTATQMHDHLPKGAIGIVSQSGALMGTLLAQAYTTGIGVSSAISVGNQADLELCDFFEYLIDDVHTRVICLYTEGLKSPQRFVELCQQSIAAGKPVLICKAGRSQAGAHAVQSHTGSLAGTYASFEAMCRFAGALLVPDLLDMFETAMAFASTRPLTGRKLAVITGSGGGGALAVDAFEGTGMQLAELNDDTRKRLSAYMPSSHLSLPFDIGVLASHGATTKPFEALNDCALSIMADPNVAGGLYVMTTQPHMEGIAKLSINLNRQTDKPFFLVNLSGNVGAQANQVMYDAGLPVFTHIASAAAALERLHALHQTLANPPPWQRHPAQLSPDKADAWLDSLPASGRDPVTLSQLQTLDWLNKSGVRIPRQCLVTSVTDALSKAQEIGYPVVLKMEVRGLSHKSEVCGVLLGLRDATSVHEGYSQLLQSAQLHGLNEQWLGCLVQEMVPADVELIVGTRWDEQFGTQLLLGHGGTLVELLRDVRLMPATLDRSQVLSELQTLKMFPLLTGFRGGPAADLERVIDMVMTIAALALALGPRLLEFDANPVRISGSQVCVADARAVLR